jgi:protein-disulfide isomerase
VNLAKKSKTKSKATEKTPFLVYIGIGLIAVLVVVALIQVGKPVTNNSSPEEILSGVEQGINDQGFPYLGSQNAPVEIILYEDYGCHNCKSFFETTEPDLLEEFVANGDIRLQIHPIAFVNNQSKPGAEAALCALEQGKYWEYRHQLFTNQGVRPFTRTNLVSFAQITGLETDVFASCYDQGKYSSQVRAWTEAAKTAGVRGTPSFLIGGKLYEGVLSIDSTNPDQPGIRQILAALIP